MIISEWLGVGIQALLAALAAILIASIIGRSAVFVVTHGHLCLLMEAMLHGNEPQPDRLQSFGASLVGATTLWSSRGPIRQRSRAGSSPGRTGRPHAQRPPRHGNESQPDHLAALANFALSRCATELFTSHRLRQSVQDVRFDHQQLTLRRGRRWKGAIGDGNHQLAGWNHNDQLAVQSYGAVGRRRPYRGDPP
jgi:hypothetical protein